MKKIMIILAVIATVFASCSKIETSKTDSGNSGLKFEGEICSIDGVATKAIKTGWEVGDKISVWYDKNKDSNPAMTIVYTYKEGEGYYWKVSSDSKAPSSTSGNVKVIYNDDVKVTATTTYEYKSETVYFNISDWTFLTHVQVVVTGLNKDEAEQYTLACNKFTPWNGYSVGDTSIDAAAATKGCPTVGVKNDDGVAFFFLTTENVTSGTKILFTLTDQSTTKQYTLSNKAIASDIKTIKAIKIDGTDSGKFKEIPSGAVPGIFTVKSSNPTTKVYFSKGNLYWDGSAFKFETNQYDYPSDWSNNHVSHFFWSPDKAKAYSTTFSNPSDGKAGNFFTNSNTTSPNGDFTVNDVTGKYRSLSETEWQYLFNNHKKAWATVADKNGYIIAPDGYNEDITKKTYTADEWTAAENEGFVFLPAAGSRSYSTNKGVTTQSINDPGTKGYYWTSKGAYSNKTYSATHEDFTSTNVSQNSGSRGTGYAVRLVRSIN